MTTEKRSTGELVPPENFVGKLAARGRSVEIDPSVAFECRMHGAGTTQLPHTRAGLHALHVRAVVVLRELRQIVGELYGAPTHYGAKYCESRIEKVDARIAADISKASAKIKETV